MLYPFEKSLKDSKEIINEDTYYKLTGLNKSEIADLSGIQGIRLLRYDQVKLQVNILETKYPILRACILLTHEATKSKIQSTITINIEKEFIVNDDISCLPKKQGFGFELILHQTSSAKNMGFKEIRCFAMGDFLSIEKYNGYITWGKLGFVMYKKGFHTKFNSVLEKGYDILISKKETLINPGYLTSKNLNILLLTPQGEKLWTELGYPWAGKFNLGNRTQSTRILHMYAIVRDLVF